MSYLSAQSGGAPGGGISTLNGLVTTTQNFAVGNTGTTFNISSIAGTHTFNIPDAAIGVRGLVTITQQTFQGNKTFQSLGLTGLTIADLPTGGSLGSSASTVDSNSLLLLTQTTSNQALLIPTPTVPPLPGKLLYVTHGGSATGTTLNGQPIAPDTSLLFIYDGNTWNPIVSGSNYNSAYPFFIS